MLNDTGIGETTMNRSIGVGVHGLRTWMGAAGLKRFAPLAIRLAILFLVLFAWTIEASAAIGTPVGIGNAGYASPTSSYLNFPVHVTLAVAVNNTVIIAIVSYNSSTATVSDTSGNSYTKDAEIVNSAFTHLLVYSARVTTALSTSSIIYVNNPNGIFYINASAFSVSGLVLASRVDKTVTAVGTSTTPSVGPTATTAQANELLIGAFGLDVSSGTPAFTAGGGDTARSAEGARGGGGVYPEYKIVSATAAYSANGTWNSGVADWSAAIVTYKAAEVKLTFTTQPSGGPAGT